MTLLLTYSLWSKYNSYRRWRIYYTSYFPKEICILLSEVKLILVKCHQINFIYFCPKKLCASKCNSYKRWRIYCRSYFPKEICILLSEVKLIYLRSNVTSPLYFYYFGISQWNLSFSELKLKNLLPLQFHTRFLYQHWLCKFKK